MRNLALCLSVCGVLLCGWALAAPQTPEKKVTSEHVNALIEKLASAKFADRERAMKELQRLAPMRCRRSGRCCSHPMRKFANGSKCSCGSLTISS